MAQLILPGSLINTPANDMGPRQIETIAREVAESHGATITVTTGEALRQALLGSLAEVAGRTRDTANDPSVEAVHQMRVALRRMRSLALVFRRRLDEAPAATVRAGLRDLAQACGEVRELDVLMAMGPAGPALDTALSEARHRAAAGLSAGLAAAPARLTLLEGLLLAETGDWPGLARNAEGAAEGLGSDLERRWRRIRREGLDADALEPEDLHALRLHIKAFRYALAAFECPDWRRAAPGFEAALPKCVKNTLCNKGNGHKHGGCAAPRCTPKTCAICIIVHILPIIHDGKHSRSRPSIRYPINLYPRFINCHIRRISIDCIV
jgi:hypothetical protein